MGCETSFSQKCEFESHVNEVHQKTKPFNCCECLDSFSLKNHLKMHMAEAHQKFKTFKCDECLNSFNKKENLEKHREARHSKTKSLEKEVCSKYEATFEKKIQLQKQMKTVHHKPYKCHVCASSFENKGLLKQHYIDVHPKIKIRKCKHCNKCFYEKSKLKSHLNKKHQTN